MRYRDLGRLHRKCYKETAAASRAANCGASKALPLRNETRLI
jgi:hypothetical protein